MCCFKIGIRVKEISSHAHKPASWYLFGVLCKFSDEHPPSFLYWGPSPSGQRCWYSQTSQFRVSVGEYNAALGNWKERLGNSFKGCLLYEGFFAIHPNIQFRPLTMHSNMFNKAIFLRKGSPLFLDTSKTQSVTESTVEHGFSCKTRTGLCE